MFASKTVFIIGAGAGDEIGMPVGSQLAQTITQKMSVEHDSVGRLQGGGDKDLIVQMHHAGCGSIDDILIAAGRLKSGLPLVKSIDDFLEIRQDDKLMVKLGKAAIVKTILEAERASRIRFERKHISDTIPFVTLSETWFVKFMQMLGRGGEDAIFNNTAFIVFNYDRCLEYFLFYAVQALYGYDIPRAETLLRRAKIFHPYGTVGGLAEFDTNGISFGAKDKSWSLLADKIFTYSEDMGSPDLLTKMQEHLASAEQLVFLGFGFHKQNMDLLTRHSALYNDKRVYATGFGLSEANARIVKNRILAMFDPTVHSAMEVSLHAKLKCAGLLGEYMLTIPGGD